MIIQALYCKTYRVAAYLRKGFHTYTKKWSILHDFLSLWQPKNIWENDLQHLKRKVVITVSVSLKNECYLLFVHYTRENISIENNNEGWEKIFYWLEIKNNYHKGVSKKAICRSFYLTYA